MSNVNLSYGTATALTVTGLSTLASGSYATSNAYNDTTGKPLDVMVEVSVTVGTVAGNKQAVVFAIDSVDATNYSDSSQDANMRLLGVISTPTNATAYRGPAMSVAAAFGGTLPPYFKVVVKNDSGAAFTAGSAQTIEVSATVV